VNKITPYLRDGRAPLPDKESTSLVMRANRAKNTSPELTLRRELWKAGIKGYRLHWSKVPGRPDIVFSARRVAIFVNGCFWHRCPYCHHDLPKTHRAFWQEKFSKNIARDERNRQLLENDGWKVLTIWECEIKKDIRRLILNIKMSLSSDGNKDEK
jgi:DNA mismatch endonuclease, patch repair protein